MNLLSRLKPLSNSTKPNLVLPRRGGHARILTPYPSPFLFRQFKNILHFYCFVTLVPTVLVLSYINIVIGPAELRDIPEGYEPKEWEYERHPITRFFLKYIMIDYKSKYELDLAYLAKENEKYMLRKIEKRVKEIMSTKSDYASWFYKPATAGYIRSEREKWRHQWDESGVNIDNPKPQ